MITGVRSTETDVFTKALWERIYRSFDTLTLLYLYRLISTMSEIRKVHHRDKISLIKPRYDHPVTPQQATPRTYGKTSMHQS